MHLDHVNLCATDVPGLARTLERHFGYRLLQSGRTPDVEGVVDPGRAFAFLLGEDRSTIVVTQIDPRPDGGPAYPAQFHVGLIQESAEAVHAKHAELVAAGLRPGPVSDGFEVFGAVWTAFYCPVGDGLEIEVNHRTRSPVLDGD